MSFFNKIFRSFSSKFADIKELKVGLVLTKGGLGDDTFNDSAYRGLRSARKEFGITIEYVENSAWKDDAQSLRTFAEKGFDLLIATSYTAVAPMKELALEYPDIKFAIIDTAVEGIPNVASVVFRESEGSFLAGALAAMMSEAGVVGFLGASNIPIINYFKDGYKKGAKYINPNIELVHDYIGGENPYESPEIARNITTDLIQQGADVVFHAAGNSGAGAFSAVDYYDIFGIGVDSNQDHMFEGKILTSLLKNVDNAVYFIVESMIRDNFKSGVHEYGLIDNGMSLTEFEFTKDIIGSKNIEKLNEIKAKLINGEIKYR